MSTDVVDAETQLPSILPSMELSERFTTTELNSVWIIRFPSDT
jgi:hypothetical protein